MNSLKIRKFIISLLLLIVGGAILFYGWWLWSAGPQTVWRIITSDESSIEDFKQFPQRTLTASDTPFFFSEGSSEATFSDTISIDGQPEQPLDDFLAQNDTVAFLLIQDDHILKESYFQGYDASTPTLAFSMSKAFLSMLIGMAINDGAIQSVDQPVTDFVPELQAEGFDEVKLYHLLQMTSGMDYEEKEGRDSSLHNRFYYTSQLEFELLRLDLAQEPGQEFSYKSGENALLGLILARAIAPMTITEYTQERLWTPLGMAHGGGWSLDAEGGLEKTWCCLAATPHDYAKLGRLMLNNGEWNGRSLLSPEWVAQSTQLDSSEGSAWNYQYQWWLVSEDGSDFTALGHLGQFVYVHPAKNLIIVRLGTSRGDLSWDQWKAALVTIADGVE